MFKKIKAIKFIIFCCFFSNIVPSISQTNETVPLNNITQHESPKQISSVIFEDFFGNKVNLQDYFGKLMIINLWTTWCKPCEKEMPSLDNLYQNKNFKNLVIFPVNMEKPNHERAKNFFSDINIKKLEVFFDPNFNLVKEFKLRGVPTTVLINKKGAEFARILGPINFEDEKFLSWLLNYD